MVQKSALTDLPKAKLFDLANEIIELFEQFNRLGMTILIVSHDLSLITQFKHRRLTLAEGKLLDAPVTV